MKNNSIDEQAQVATDISIRLLGIFKTLGTWASYLAIIGFLFTAQRVYSTYTGFVQIYESYDFYAESQMLTRIVLITFVSAALSIASYIIPSVFLWKFSTSAKLATTSGDREEYEKMFTNLNVFFKSIGIFIILFFVFIIFTVIMGMLG